LGVVGGGVKPIGRVREETRFSMVKTFLSRPAEER
jgi:hypothetical protein